MKWFNNKSPHYQLVNLNLSKINNELIEILEKIPAYKDEDGFLLMMSLFKTAINKSILDCANAKDDHDRIKTQARLSCFTEVVGLIEDAIVRKTQAIKDGKKEPDGVVKITRRAINNQAGSAI